MSGCDVLLDRYRRFEKTCILHIQGKLAPGEPMHILWENQQKRVALERKVKRDWFKGEEMMSSWLWQVGNIEEKENNKREQE
jgi:hypothetical protein